MRPIPLACPALLSATLLLGCSATCPSARPEAPAEPPAAAAPSPTSAALDLATDYLQRIRRREGAQAADACWDYHAFATRVFGKDMNWQTPDEKARIEAMLRQLSRTTIGSDRFAGRLIGGRIPRLEASELPSGDVYVRIVVHYTAQGQPAQSETGVLVRTIDGKARIIDSGKLERTAGDELGRRYRQTTQSPVKFMEQMMVLVAAG